MVHSESLGKNIRYFLRNFKISRKRDEARPWHKMTSIYILVPLTQLSGFALQVTITEQRTLYLADLGSPEPVD